MNFLVLHKPWIDVWKCGGMTASIGILAVASAITLEGQGGVQ